MDKKTTKDNLGSILNPIKNFVKKLRNFFAAEIGSIPQGPLILQNLNSNKERFFIPFRQNHGPTHGISISTISFLGAYFLKLPPYVKD